MMTPKKARLKDAFNISYSPTTTWTGTNTSFVLPSDSEDYSAPEDRRKTPMEWLDDRVGDICAVGRL